MAATALRGVPPVLYFGSFATMADRFAVAPLLIPIAGMFVIAAIVTLPVLIIGSLARWQYPGSDAIVDAGAGRPIG